MTSIANNNNTNNSNNADATPGCALRGIGSETPSYYNYLAQRFGPAGAPQPRAPIFDPSLWNGIYDDSSNGNGDDGGGGGFSMRAGGSRGPSGAKINIGASSLVQSAYLNLEAAGSDEDDDTARGFHLRWDFRRSLGQHLAKGTLSGPSATPPYQSSTGFNKDSDFVEVYRTPYVEDFISKIDLTASPSSAVETGLTREWSYSQIIPVSFAPSNDNTGFIRFDDVAQYDAVRATYDPATNPSGFIGAYTGVLEAGIVGKRSFYARISLGKIRQKGDSGNGQVRLESVSLPDLLDESMRTLSSRKDHTALAIGVDKPDVMCSNIEHIRFDYGFNAKPIMIEFITYHDYILGSDTNDVDYGNWKDMGDFALTLDDVEVDTRLEQVATTVDSVWPKFNDAGVNGKFRVNLANYVSKWDDANDGLKDAVDQYVELSTTDPSATLAIANNDPLTNSSYMDVSYLDMLQIVSLDYHVARMLGQGHIDHHDTTPVTDKYVYLIKYKTLAQLEDETAATVDHIYMTPPLSMLDSRLPPVPTIELEYGLEADNFTNNPTSLTDDDGYTPFGDVRFINVNRDDFRYEFPFETFFQTNDEFHLCSTTQPVLFGVEYGDGAIQTGFVEPELNHDPNYTDASGLEETISILNGATNPVYLHKEEEEGVHHYGLYSINWFSRVSPVSDEKATDATVFPKRITLMPPSNFAVQLIQEEQPLIFTSLDEQINYDGLTTTDKTMVRCTFDYDYHHHQAYQFGDTAQLFYRKQAPVSIRGTVDVGTSVVDAATHEVTIETADLIINSGNTQQTIVPTIPDAEKQRFIGSKCVVNGEHFTIVDITTSVGGANPTIKLEQIRQTHSQEVPLNSNIFNTTETYENPEEGEQFIIVENLDQASAWDVQLAKEVDLSQVPNSHTETIVRSDGTSKILSIGGIVDTAKITQIDDDDPSLPPNTPSGAYTVIFDVYELTPHTDPDVEFYKGTFRVMNAAGTDMKVLQVWKIDLTQSTLELTIFDATFAVDPIISGLSSTGVSVNFHPGYRVYLYEDLTGSGTVQFDEVNMLPAAGEGTRTTLMSARSVDTSESPIYYESYFQAPTPVLAREIVEPVPPGAPDGPTFATRPNFFGKATYTFDVLVEDPFALIFFRASEQTVLDQLYATDTVATILDDLANLTSPDLDFNQNRWNDLVNMNFDPATNQFREYVAGGFQFPMPDNIDYLIPHADPSVVENPFPEYPVVFTFVDTYSYTDPTLGLVEVSMIDVVKDAIDGAFLPLTENPALYSSLQETDFFTSGRKPIVRNQNGDRYLPTDAAYDPWPMAFRFEKNTGGNVLQAADGGYGNAANTKHVRFTDYNIDGAAQNFYFYFAAELASNLKVSDRSDVAGPIQLVNSSPAEEPEIRKVITQLRNDVIGNPTAVNFELNEYLEADNITEIRIYRTTLAANSHTVRTMDLVKTVPIGGIVEDDFENDVTPLYGDPLFYRIVVYREIMNEQGVIEMVPSKASNVAVTNVVDNINPLPPSVSYSAGAPINSPIELPNVSLSWNKTAHNATYYVYKQNSAGNWTKIHQVDRDEHGNAAVMSVDLIDTDLATTNLFKQDTDLNTIYSRFRVDVENSSGLLNLTKDELTV
jgi:hypothetical protein